MQRIVHTSRRRGLALVTILALLLAGCSQPGEENTEAPPPRAESLTGTVAAAAPEPVAVGLRVLVLDDGAGMVGAVTERLQLEGVPTTVVTLREPGRTVVTHDLLATTADDGTVRANFVGIVVPGADSALLAPEEHAALVDYQRSFGVRVVETNPGEGKDLPQPGYEGPLAGATAQVTDSGLEGAFSYLDGSVHLDADADAEPVWGILTPGSLRPAEGAEFEPLVTTVLPGTDVRAPLVAVQRSAGLENMLLGFDGDRAELATEVLSHGIVRWLVRGVSTGYSRNHLAIHVDDVLLPNAQWSVDGQCEVGRNCGPEHADLEPIRMVAEDIPFLVEWQQANDLKLDVVLNGAGAAQYAADHGRRDPLMEAMKDHREDLRLISHTWTHRFLGCERDVLPNDWQCRTDEAGNILWLDQDTIDEELVKNLEFMAKNDLDNHDPRELVTGEHSGLIHAPQQMVDNPHLAPAVDEAGIRWVASDNSEAGEQWPRALGGATTVPRHPVDLDYNTPTARQVTSQYNWLFTTAAEGGSGLCELYQEYAPCVAPLDLDRGFAEVIALREGRKMLEHAVGNDPRPHYAHQANLAGERLLYPIVDIALAEYRATYADNAPLLNPSMTESGEELVRQRNWLADRDLVDATVSGQLVTLRNGADRDIKVPLTLPEGARVVTAGRVGDPFGEPYAGARSAWVTVPAGSETVLQLEQPVAFAARATWPPVPAAG